MSPAPSPGPEFPHCRAVLPSRWVSWACQTSSGEAIGHTLSQARHPCPGVLGGGRASGSPGLPPSGDTAVPPGPAPTLGEDRRESPCCSYIRWPWPQCAGAGGAKSWDPFHKQAAKSLTHSKAKRDVTQTSVTWEDLTNEVSTQ